MKKWLFILMMCTSIGLYGQDKTPITDSDYANQEVEMADGMRESGKIYVLTGIILIILAGTITYLISIDRKVSKIEKSINKES